MAISYGDGRDRDLIEDISPPKASAAGYDVRSAYVRRQSIGQLDEQYLRRRAFSRPQIIDDSKEKIGRWLNYTRIPPLKALERNSPASRDKRTVGQRLSSLFDAVKRERYAISLGLGSWIGPTRLRFWPHRYTAREGLVETWQDKAVRWTKWLAPLLILAAIALVVLLATPAVNHQTHHQRAGATSAISPSSSPTKNQTNNTAASPSTNTPNGSKAATNAGGYSGGAAGGSGSAPSSSYGSFGAGGGGAAGAYGGGGSGGSAGGTSGSSTGSSAGSGGSSSPLPPVCPTGQVLSTVTNLCVPVCQTAQQLIDPKC